MNQRKQQANTDREAKLAALRAAQRRKERRRAVILLSAAVVVALALVGTVVYTILGERNRIEAAEAAAAAPIEGVQEYPDLPRNHVPTAVAYAQNPPVGGDHAGVWTNCGVYREVITPEESVHSLEHGAVWITYRSDLPAEQVAVLTDLVQGNDYALLSPVEDLPSPVVASAWGLQLPVEEATDPRLPRFLTKYLQGEQTPEPGAPCIGGTRTPTA